MRELFGLKLVDFGKIMAIFLNLGEIIFFDWENDNDPDHVGIVEKVENNYIYTIEGNSKDECRSRKYRIGYKRIYGYGKSKIGK